MKNFIDEFKKFVLRGNVIELAVGMLMGTAFATLVGEVSLNIIKPIITALGGAQEGSWMVNILGANLGIGDLITALINFLVTALVAFLIVQGYNNLQKVLLRKKDVEEEAKGPSTEELLAEILEALKK